MVADPYVIIQNLGKIAVMVQSVAVFMGVSLIFGSLFHFKKYGEQRTFMSQQMTIAGPSVKLLAGVCMLLLPTFIDTAVQAFWTSHSPVRYPVGNHGWDQYIPVVLVFTRLIGVGAIIRSIILFSRAGSSGGQPGSLGKAGIMFVSGLLLLHVVGVYHLFQQILDYT